MKKLLAYYLGKRIIKLRTLHGLNQSRFAKALNMPVTQVAKIEKAINLPRAETLARFEALLGVERGSLIAFAQRMAWRPSQECKDSRLLIPESINLKRADRTNLECVVLKTLDEQRKSSEEKEMPATVDLGLNSLATRSDEDGIFAARQLRETLQIGTLSFKHALERLKRRNVLILSCQTLPIENHSYPPCELKSVPFYDRLYDNFAICVNRKIPEEEQLYLVAYGLGQLIVVRNKERGSTPHDSGFVSGPFPKSFASELLLPKVTLNTLLDDRGVMRDNLAISDDLNGTENDRSNAEAIRRSFNVDSEFFYKRIAEISKVS